MSATHDLLGTRTIPCSGGDLTIELYATGRDRGGKSVLAYRLLQGSEVVFSGDDFCPSPLHADDSEESFAAIVGFLSLRPGDTDAEYFESYTERQLEFVSEYGDEMTLWAADIESGEGR